MRNIFVTVEIGGIKYDVDFAPEGVEVGNDGIGSYEFWGFRGFDRGHDYVEGFTAHNVRVFDYETGLEIPAPAGIQAAIEEDNAINDQVAEEFWRARQNDLDALRGEYESAY